VTCATRCIYVLAAGVHSKKQVVLRSIVIKVGVTAGCYRGMRLQSAATAAATRKTAIFFMLYLFFLGGLSP